MKALDKYCDKLFMNKLHGIKPTRFQCFLCRLSLWLYDPVSMLVIEHTAYRIKNIKKITDKQNLTSRRSRAAEACPCCGKPLIMGVCEAGCEFIVPPA